MNEFEVKATLPYALRNPDCTKTSQEDLMNMAADLIENLQDANNQLGESLERCQSVGLAIADKLKKYEAAA